MNRAKVKISAGAILTAALAYYLTDASTLAAILAPIAAHELGHMLAMWLMGFEIRGFRAELRGLCIEYGGYAGALGHALAAAGGPAAGLLYAWACAEAGGRLENEWLMLSAGVSLALSAFNLLPALPLDGGRVVLALASAFLGDERGRRVANGISMGVGALLMGAGMWLMLSGRGAAPMIAALWLLLYQDDGGGIVKMREIM